MNARFEGEGNDHLGDGGDHERPRPFGIWDIHSGVSSNGIRRELCREALAVVISTRLGFEGLRSVGLVAILLGRILPIQRLASEEGCSRLVWGNFGRMDSRELAAVKEGGSL